MKRPKRRRRKKRQKKEKRDKEKRKKKVRKKNKVRKSKSLKRSKSLRRKNRRRKRKNLINKKSKNLTNKKKRILLISSPNLPLTLMIGRDSSAMHQINMLLFNNCGPNSIMRDGHSGKLDTLNTKVREKLVT